MSEYDFDELWAHDKEDLPTYSELEQELLQQGMTLAEIEHLDAGGVFIIAKMTKMNQSAMKF